MGKVEDFLSPKEEKEIVQAIIQAERNTSGEIRVHIETQSKTNHFNRALEVFHSLKMYNTKARNAVLIYIAVLDHQFVIYGDQGINKIVGANFWNSTRDIMQHQFKKGNFKKGIIDGILEVGNELKSHFPWDKNDIDELSNEVSKA